MLRVVKMSGAELGVGSGVGRWFAVKCVCKAGVLEDGGG